MGFWALLAYDSRLGILHRDYHYTVILSQSGDLVSGWHTHDINAQGLSTQSASARGRAPSLEMTVAW
ncbi:MAG TPA: hypothetical protein VJO35_01605 [Terriglobales bacterium]|nr:hypothetical protein [Terriglobales bacterium]